MKATWMTARASVVGLALALALAGCTGTSSENGGDGSSSSSTESSTESQGKSPEQLANEVADATPPEPAATMTGELTNAASMSGSTAVDIPAELGVVEVKATERSTVLTWEISSSRPAQVTSLTQVGTGFANINLITLVDTGGDKRYHVVEFADGKECLCGQPPTAVDSTPFRITTTYPALPAGVSKVRVDAPGFESATVDVSR
ncbi:hypothetical protein [Kribbia dieselivorans]|uniref:hypothetical protein n=1 Tax=Kribbia dieselivorans TaxID=331526 RepID=UPI000839106D|nr:hypothetical protein [Kribbia dieselivorans]